MDTFLKQPDEILDFDVDFSAFLTASSADTLSATWTVTVSGGVTSEDQTTYLDNSLPIPDYLHVDTSTRNTAHTIIKVWLSGGRDGIKYKVTVVATTVGGRVKEHDFYIRVKDV